MNLVGLCWSPAAAGEIFSFSRKAWPVPASADVDVFESEPILSRSFLSRLAARMFPFLMLDFLCNSENSLPALPAFSGAFLANMSYVRPPAPLVPSSPQPHWHCSSWALASLPSEMGEPSTQSYWNSCRMKKQDQQAAGTTLFLAFIWKSYIVLIFSPGGSELMHITFQRISATFMLFANKLCTLCTEWSQPLCIDATEGPTNEIKLLFRLRNNQLEFIPGF